MKCYQFSLPIFFDSSQLFFLVHDKHFEANEKNPIELLNRLPHFIAQSIDCYVGLDESIFFFLVFFLEKTAFDLLAFSSLQGD